MSCTNNCNQGRACTCGTPSPAVTFIAAVIWAAAVIALALVLMGAIK